MRGPGRGLVLAVLVALTGPSTASASGYAHGDVAASPYCAACISSKLIEPELLEVHVSDLPGFKGGKGHYFATASATKWAEGEETAAETEKEHAYLVSEGFVEGVASTVVAKGRESVGETLVFNTSSAARTTLANAATEIAKPDGKESLARFRVTGIPGSVGLGFYTLKQRGTASNVLFATGRCFVLVADRVVHARTLVQANRAAVTAAKRLYKRVHNLCANNTSATGETAKLARWTRAPPASPTGMSPSGCRV
jgi:hypothetical protein